MDSGKKVWGRKRRQRRVRKSIRGSDGCPRVCVFRSSKHIYAQLISDESGRTLLSVSTLSSGGSGHPQRKGVEAAREIGKSLAELCKEKGIARVVFDRNGFLYHGRVKALAEGAREAGLTF